MSARDERFWTFTTLDPADVSDYVAVVDEAAGGVVAYVRPEIAETVLSALVTASEVTR